MAWYLKADFLRDVEMLSNGDYPNEAQTLEISEQLDTLPSHDLLLLQGYIAAIIAQRLKEESK